MEREQHGSLPVTGRTGDSRPLPEEAVFSGSPYPGDRGTASPTGDPPALRLSHGEAVTALDSGLPPTNLH